MSEDDAAQSALEAKLVSLAVPAAAGDATSELAPKVSGNTYRFDENPYKVETVELEADGGACTLVVHNDLGEHRLAAKMGEWLLGKTTLMLGPGRHGPDGREPIAIAASAAWTSANTLQVRVSLYLTPFMQTLTLAFEGDDMTLTVAMNVGFVPEEPPVLLGHKA